MLAVVGGLIFLQVMTRRNETRPSPGPARGDLTLVKGVLPDVIDGWQCINFQPGLSPEQLPDGQFWWTHSWQYQFNSMTAIVAFDQADWRSWHELTVCYQAIGWQLVNRQRIKATSGSDVEPTSTRLDQVIAVLEKPPLQKATLLFSLFDQEGKIIPPPEIGMPGTQTEQAPKGISQTLMDRFTYELPVGAMESAGQTYDRILQCQVFVQHEDPLREEQIQQLSQLHLATREIFRQAWLTSRPPCLVTPEN